MTEPHILLAREYKLLLDPAAFARKPLDTAATFWKRYLAPLVDCTPGVDRSGELSKVKQRHALYWDTRKHLLFATDYALRQRRMTDSDDDKPLRLALKLRSADLFVAAMTAAEFDRDKLRGSDVSFEEDIAPLAVAPGGPRAAFAERPSIRSRFALTVEGKIGDEDAPETLEEAAELFPMLRADIAQAGKRLRAGPDIKETVLTGAMLMLGATQGEVALTLWHFDDASEPNVAEISFKCGLKKGRMPRQDALAALLLFNGIQSQLGDWINRKQTSKTELALP